jgi:coenzyme PQQ precursor peptide PqqA
LGGREQGEQGYTAPSRLPLRSHENHEAQITIRPLSTAPCRASISFGVGNGVAFNLPRSKAMVWEKPAAINWRFGMEITLYVANR